MEAMNTKRIPRVVITCIHSKPELCSRFYYTGLVLCRGGLFMQDKCAVKKQKHDTDNTVELCGK